jgi:multicomponent Na+:H+ antiporter subunit B
MKHPEQGMTLIVKTVTRLTVGLILIYGIYIILQGHVSPGGGFAGGVILALSFIHLMLAFGKDAVIGKLSQRRGLTLSCLGGAAFLFLAALGFLGRGCPCKGKGYFAVLHKVFCPVSELSVALMMGASLLVIFLALVLLTGAKEEK